MLGTTHAQQCSGTHFIPAVLQLLKERASGMYRLSAFYFARMASDLPMDMAIPTVFVIILYFMSGLRTDGAKYFFENYFAVVLVRDCRPLLPCPPSAALRELRACSISGSMTAFAVV